ncbi:MAG TPA: PQQ-dependent sugar dehydrogenase [Tepidisphaeraceae bacterium]|nr:PQQ-dependent sugar dehydrogenase [Tepidisphaeraceae bacterium]
MKIRAAGCFVTLMIAAFNSAAAAAQAPQIELEPFVTGLRAPVYLTNDGSSRIFIIEESGRIRLVEDGKILPTPYLDIHRKVTLDPSTHEAGMLCLAFSPHFAQNGKFYVFYTTGSRRAHTLKNIIAEFTASSPAAATVDPSTERDLLVIPKDYLFHNGGDLFFGPDGDLYIGVGDGGPEYDPHYNGQNISIIYGKILRIDVDHRDPGLQYAIPKDNPFVGLPNHRAEIWAYGLRNPWRSSFDPATGLLYTADVGQDRYESIYIIKKGGNYGWSIREGTHTMEGVHHHEDPDPSDWPVMINPIKEYPHPVVQNVFPSNVIGRCVMGGYVYRGGEFPSLDGWYIYGDFTKSWIAALRYQDGRVTGDQPLMTTKFRMSSFGVDAAGSIYVLDFDLGNVYKIVAP